MNVPPDPPIHIFQLSERWGVDPKNMIAALALLGIGTSETGHVHVTEEAEAYLKKTFGGSQREVPTEEAPSNAGPTPTEPEPIPNAPPEPAASASQTHAKASGPAQGKNTQDYAIVMHRADLDGLVIFPEANEKALAFAGWLTSPQGANIPEENLYPRRGHDWGISTLQQIEHTFFALMDDALSGPGAVPDGRKRLFVYAAGALLGGVESAPFICGAGTEKEPLSIKLVDVCERLAELGLFAEVHLFVDGIAIRLPVDDSRLMVPYSWDLLRGMPGRSGTPGRLFTCIANMSLADTEDGAGSMEMDEQPTGKRKNPKRGPERPYREEAAPPPA